MQEAIQTKKKYDKGNISDVQIDQTGAVVINGIREIEYAPAGTSEVDTRMLNLYAGLGYNIISPKLPGEPYRMQIPQEKFLLQQQANIAKHEARKARRKGTFGHFQGGGFLNERNEESVHAMQAKAPTRAEDL